MYENENRAYHIKPSERKMTFPFVPEGLRAYYTVGFRHRSASLGTKWKHALLSSFPEAVAYADFLYAGSFKVYLEQTLVLELEGILYTVSQVRSNENLRVLKQLPNGAFEECE